MNKGTKKKDKVESKDIYFIILYTRKVQEKPGEFASTEKHFNPKMIYIDEEKLKTGRYFYKKVFKFNGKTNNKYSLNYEIGEHIYVVSFEVKENSFVLDVELKRVNKILKQIARENIDQNIVDNIRKLDIFLEALRQNDEENKIDTLYKDSIDLFEKKKGFSFLIPLFVKIYKNKVLCPLLIKIFKEMNNKPKYNEKNLDRNKDLEEYINIFQDISSEADNLIKSNDYDPIQFYAIILCYLNYYDKDTFQELLEKLIAEKSECLYEILLIYFSHFLNPIKQNIDFFVKLITINVELTPPLNRVIIKK